MRKTVLSIVGVLLMTAPLLIAGLFTYDTGVKAMKITAAQGSVSSTNYIPDSKGDVIGSNIDWFDGWIQASTDSTIFDSTVALLELQLVTGWVQVSTQDSIAVIVGGTKNRLKMSDIVGSTIRCDSVYSCSDRYRWKLLTYPTDTSAAAYQDVFYRTYGD